MFREMRRFRQQLSDEETAAILEKGKTGILGVIGDGGYPYTVPVNYVYSGGKIYFHGAKAGHKFDAMSANDKVSFCVIDKDDVVAEELTTYFRSAVAFGRVRILTDESEIIEAARILGLKYYNVPEAVDSEIRRDIARLCCFEITIEHLTGKEAIELTRQRKQNK
ncbi:MAG: pyridoxamine 5'-phosphate oxidase family protein [Oscillospiraceae bacterium]|nr:pyridoxamine 5'-phosphate oxidase family protein [Oscillospiraceae bacterium]